MNVRFLGSVLIIEDLRNSYVNINNFYNSLNVGDDSMDINNIFYCVYYQLQAII